MRPLLRTTARTAFVVGALLLTRRMTLTWGTRDGEHQQDLPGDDAVPDAAVVATRAVSIGAPPERVWPWVAQIGFGRGGFYSYDWAEQAIGLDIVSADRIEERWQGIEVGDEVSLAPEIALEAVGVEPNHHLVLFGGEGRGRSPAAGGPGNFDFCWSFVLRAEGSGTRLIVRERYRPHSLPGRAAVEVAQPLSSVMTARMLRGIRERATRR